MDFKNLITQEKVIKLKPIIESILSRKHGRDINITDLSVYGVNLENEVKQNVKSNP